MEQSMEPPGKKIPVIPYHKTVEGRLLHRNFLIQTYHVHYRVVSDTPGVVCKSVARLGSEFLSSLSVAAHKEVESLLSSGVVKSIRSTCLDSIEGQLLYKHIQTLERREITEPTSATH